MSDAAAIMAFERTAVTAPLDRLATLFDTHHQRLHRLARRLSSDPEEARDLVQETFLRAARRPTAVPTGEPAGEAWLVRVLVNLCHDRCRRRAVREQGRPSIPQPQIAPNPEAAAVARATVSAALAWLPPRRRAVVVLSELEGLDTHQVAKLLGIAVVTVRWHLAAGRKELAMRLMPVPVSPLSPPSLPSPPVPSAPSALRSSASLPRPASPESPPPSATAEQEKDHD